MLLVLAHNAYDTLPAYNATFLAHAADRSADFHEGG